MRSCRAISTCAGGRLSRCRRAACSWWLTRKMNLFSMSRRSSRRGSVRGVGDFLRRRRVAHLVQDDDVADPVVPGQLQPLLEHLKLGERCHVAPALFSHHVSGATGAPVGNDGLDPRRGADLVSCAARSPRANSSLVSVTTIGASWSNSTVDSSSNSPDRSPPRTAQHEQRLHRALGGAERSIRLARQPSELLVDATEGGAGRRCGRAPVEGVHDRGVLDRVSRPLRVNSTRADQVPMRRCLTIFSAAHPTHPTAAAPDPTGFSRRRCRRRRGGSPAPRGSPPRP